MYRNFDFKKSKDKNIAFNNISVALSYEILQLFGAVLGICGLVVVNFLLIVYIILKKLNGHLEKSAIYTISGVALLLFLSSIILFSLGA